MHFCLEENQEARGGLLTDWEVDFLTSLLNFKALSPKQHALLPATSEQAVESMGGLTALVNSALLSAGAGRGAFLSVMGQHIDMRAG